MKSADPRPTGRRRYLRRALVPALLVGLVAGCRLLEHEVAKPAAASPLQVFVAVDHSSSYGVDSTRVRRSSAQQTFAAAKRRLRDVLGAELKHGDELVGVVPFTDEEMADLSNRIPSGSIRIDSTRTADRDAEVNLTLDGIELRPPTDNYRTVYGQAQEAALDRFVQLGTPLDQRLVIFLTDELGSEAAPGSEVPPEAFRHAYTLVFRATPSGALRLTPNDLLAELVAGEDSDAAGYIEAVRTAYRAANPVAVTTMRIDRVAYMALVVVLAGLGARRLIVRRRTVARAPRLENAFFSAQAGAVVLDAANLVLPEQPTDYVVDGGAVQVSEVRRLDNGRVHIVFADAPAPGDHLLQVQTSAGPLSHAFDVLPSRRAEVYELSIARVTDLAHPRSMKLGTTEVELLEGFGLKSSLLARREGDRLVLRPRGGRVRAEDGAEIVGHRTLLLSDVLSRTLVLDLEDEHETVELSLRRAS